LRSFLTSRPPRHRLALLIAAGGTVLALGCATPSERFDQAAAAQGLSRHVVQGGVFHHAVYARGLEGSPGLVRVYLEGDGSARRAVRFTPPDPTPGRRVALELLALDPGPALYLGRPCAHAVEPCDPWIWTLGRYGEDVVESLVAAVRRELSSEAEVVLVGFSGGGALAMLMAERLEQARAVVTVAGNLDVGAWVEHHGYEPLVGSLDPARRPPLEPAIFQLHLLAGRDRVVPPELTREVVERQPGALFRLHPDFDHRCCWAAVWPSVLGELERALSPDPAD
jgi:pimeloyl-ACP methyl ester carboxylesterase